ncbi:unnamed protein product [Protopolystoma xenopodis]|uniref:Uncharacterized protein n=1 Tax=Protopolystoma xenopodis TaxID=117903 RepID=A0A448X1R0_9PLAT|nr:unnamed protein product [Protopolystoma xenopodis]
MQHPIPRLISPTQSASPLCSGEPLKSSGFVENSVVASITTPSPALHKFGLAQLVFGPTATSRQSTGDRQSGDPASPISSTADISSTSQPGVASDAEVLSSRYLDSRPAGHIGSKTTPSDGEVELHDRPLLLSSTDTIDTGTRTWPTDSPNGPVSSGEPDSMLRTVGVTASDSHDDTTSLAYILARRHSRLVQSPNSQPSTGFAQPLMASSLCCGPKTASVRPAHLDSVKTSATKLTNLPNYGRRAGTSTTAASKLLHNHLKRPVVGASCPGQVVKARLATFPLAPLGPIDSVCPLSTTSPSVSIPSSPATERTRSNGVAVAGTRFPGLSATSSLCTSASSTLSNHAFSGPASSRSLQLSIAFNQLMKSFMPASTAVYSPQPSPPLASQPDPSTMTKFASERLVDGLTTHSIKPPFLSGNGSDWLRKEQIEWEPRSAGRSSLMNRTEARLFSEHHG